MAAEQGITCAACAGGMQAAVQVDEKQVAVTGNNGINVNELNIQTIILSLIVIVVIIGLLVMLIQHFIKKCGLINWQYKHISESPSINSTEKTTRTMDDQVDEHENKFQHVLVM